MALLTFFRAEVTDNKDPDKKGRLKLRIPDITGDDVHDFWVPPKGLIQSKGFGFYAIPGVGDMVFIQFEGGDARFGTWTYGVKPEGEAFDRAYNEDGEPSRVVLQTRSGQVIAIDDDAETISIEHSSGGKIVMDADHISLIQGGTKSISIGAENESAQPAVLGDNNADRLTDLAEALGDFFTALQVDLTASTSGPYLIFASMAVQVPILQAKINAVKALIPQTKSNKVTLD